MSDDAEYTPTIKAVKSMYEEGRIATSGAYHVDEFDRWLNAERARIWEQCAQAGWESNLYGHGNRDDLMARNPYGEDA